VARVRTLADLKPAEIEGRTYLVRVDYNVPLDADGAVADSTRIDATLGTLGWLRGRGVRVVLVSHLGRPDGAPDPSGSLAPVVRVLEELLGSSVLFVESAPESAETKASVASLGAGEVALLENIRFHPGETRNAPALGRALADLADGFVSDAFGVAHRAHASNVGAAEAMRARGEPAVAGELLAAEVHFLREALSEPERPFIAVMGGAKISGKIELIRAILPRVDRLLVGGAMANTFFRALGLETGESLVEDDLVPLAKELMAEAADKLVLPVDCVVADEVKPDAATRQVDRGEVAPDDRIADIGSKSRGVFRREIERARSILWNGPMGVFEMPPFSGGTFEVARAMADAAGKGTMVVVGGGDSASAAHAADVASHMTHISTGGGAALDLLAGNELPGVSALETVDGP
jgi:phosphoglycerate kinase